MLCRETCIGSQDLLVAGFVFLHITPPDYRLIGNGSMKKILLQWSLPVLGISLLLLGLLVAYAFVSAKFDEQKQINLITAKDEMEAAKRQSLELCLEEVEGRLSGNESHARITSANNWDTWLNECKAQGFPVAPDGRDYICEGYPTKRMNEAIAAVQVQAEAERAVCRQRYQ